MAERKREKKGEWNFIPALMGSAVNAIEGFVKNFVHTAQDTAQDILRRSIEKLLAFFLVAVGTLFLAVGVAAYLSEYFHVPGAGPLIVGAAFLVIGLFFDLSRRK